MDAFVCKRAREDFSNCISGKNQETSRLISSSEVVKLCSFKDLHRTEWKTEVKNEERRERNKLIDCNDIPSKSVCFDCSISKQKETVEMCPHNWRLINGENLNLKYTRILTKKTADYVFQKLEEEVKYFSGDLLKVRVFGKMHDIPRKQVSYGDPGLTYTFSGTCVPAVPWSECKIVMKLKELVESATGHSFNFVLVNRYKNGMDHMGEHRDDEKDLVETAPIASLSLGQERDFIFRHRDARGNKAKCKIDPVKIVLEHGSLLLMQWPTNRFWYHSLPIRKKALNTRINLTFRQMTKRK